MPDDEEKLQLRADVERFKRAIRQKDEMIEEMENELNSYGKQPVSNGKAEAREKELAGQMRDLQFEMDGKDATIHEQTELISSLKVEIDKLEKTNRELMNRSVCVDSDESNLLDESQMLRISEECEKLKELASALGEENLELKKDAVTLREDYESAVEHVKSLESHSRTKEEEITRLEGELFDLRNSCTGKFANTGNSIFAEAMDAERKLEEDLKTLYREKQSLMGMVKRLTMEKEEAEERARSHMNRGLVVRNAINHIDVQELNRLNKRVRQLETEKSHFWEKIFIKMRSIPKKELGALIVGHFGAFKCSIENMSEGYDELMKKNEQHVTTIRGLQQEIDTQRVKIEQLTFDVECLERKLRSSAADSEPEDPQLRAPLQPITNAARPSFFVKPKKTNPEPSLEMSMSNMMMTPQKPSAQITCRSTVKKEDDELSEWAERRLKAKAEKKSATPAAKYNFVKLTAPAPSNKFKPAVLQMPSIQSENTDEHEQ
ncbi:hypothetical protein B9Z55_020257 [Caenorhabditis nigoni]|uniref:Uncharacterized protein n=1 Tax=Caenorhabditis nigoni TaxID=1611254 RepID=A0A2G5TMP7_9PELO|nr:hypothetical protein B9Z55_020257 [Caenorhabditis nigoni]